MFVYGPTVAKLVIGFREIYQARIYILPTNSIIDIIIPLILVFVLISTFSMAY